jgi:PKD repeat protein
MKKTATLLICFLSTIVTLNAQSVTPSASSGCAPHSVNFTATGGNWYRWDFEGDGNFTGFVGPNRNYVYTNPRTYPYYGVVEVWDNTQTTLIATLNYQVSVDGAADSISTSNYNPCVNEIVVFELSPSVNPFNISWDFGDGSPIYTNTNYEGIQHKYQNVGTYTVTSTFSTSCGTVTRNQIINVSNSGNFASNNYIYFNGSAESGCPGDNFYFSTSSIYPNYIIDFGDGNFSTTTTTHIYTSPGAYAPQITYFNGCGNSLTLSTTVTISTSNSINLSGSGISMPDSVCPGSVVNFYPNPSYYATYNWNFGNNNFSQDIFPQHTFTAVGNYPIYVVVANGCGYADTIFDTVRVVNNIPVPNASIQVQNDSVCPGGAIFFKTNLGSNEAETLGFKWDFGDGSPVSFDRQVSHTYTNAGTYSVTLYLTNDCGSNTTLITQVFVGTNVIPRETEYFAVASPGPQGQSQPACPGDSVIFVFGPYGSSGTVSWTFGDNTSALANQIINVNGTQYIIVKHAYLSTGMFTYTCTYTNSCGNSFVKTATIEIRTNSSIVEALVFADETKPFCQEKDISFFSFGGSQYEWDFGDGSGTLVTYSTFQAVNHAYANPGIYNVVCKITNSCGNFAYANVSVEVPPSLIGIATNTVSSNCGVNDGKAIAIVNGGNAPYTYQWSNSNSTFLADSLTSGIYVVTITDTRGCSNFSIATVSDIQAPVITVPTVVDVSCYGGSNGAIDINIIGNSGPYTYLWSNGATTQDILQLKAGPYELEVTDVNGCKSTKSILVTQPPEVILSMSSTSTTCSQTDGTATVSVNGSTSPYNYIWSNGDVNPTAYFLGLGIYTITVVDVKGCIYTNTVSVNESNSAVILVDSITGTGCGSNLASIYIRPVLGNSPYTYSWSTGATTQNLMNVNVGTYTVEVTSNGGCKSIKQVKVEKEIPTETSICMVTVDTLTGMNKCIFNKDTLAVGIAGFNIYKESTISGLYFLIRHVPFNSTAIWTDSLSNSAIRSWRYKVAVLDNCGNESYLSGEHKTIHLNVNSGINNTYNLIWDHYEGFAFNQYNIYRYTQSGGWALIDSVPNNLTSYTDLNPPTNTYAYKVVAVTDFTCSTNGNRYDSPVNLLAAINNSNSNIKNMISTVGVNESSLIATDFNLYPNPTKGAITISCPYSSDGYNITVYDAIGKIVFVSKNAANSTVSNFDINLTHLRQGVYHVSIENVKGKINKKLVIQ